MVERADEVTERLRTVALRLFTEAGYGNTNIEQIATEAGVGVATLYRRFPDKAAIANDLLASTLQALAEIYGPIEASRPKDRFLELWRRVHTFALGNPDAFLFLEDGAKTTFISEENLDRKAELLGDVVALLDSVGVQAPPEVANGMVMGTLVALVRAGVRPDLDDLGERLWQALRIPPR
ncbi:MAG: TetR/AcrR family transcriptional regulator [Actinomycetota bacterium]